MKTMQGLNMSDIICTATGRLVGQQERLTFYFHYNYFSLMIISILNNNIEPLALYTQ